jgi:hypothetical protein
MRAKAGLLILLGLFLMTGTVSALYADSSSTMISSKEWPVANGHDSVVFTVTAKNSTSGMLVPGATVLFTVDDAVYGSFTPTTETTDANGVATSTFSVKTKSGTAVITATITSYEGSVPHTAIKTWNQKIDHTLAQTARFDNPAKIPVASVGNLTITLTDRYGNLIDNKNPAEHHTFGLYMPLGGSGWGLWDGSNWVVAKTMETDEYGNATTLFKISNTAFLQQQISMDAIGNMVPGIGTYTYVEGIALDEPFYITQIIPSPDNLPADLNAKFNLYYYVYDRYMNPVNGTPVQITASDGTNFINSTSKYGSIFVSFGPKDTSSTYILTASPTLNSSMTTGALCLNPRPAGATQIGNCSQVLTFTNTRPENITLNANPMQMTSYDVNNEIYSLIKVRVIDIRGNPVLGETVSFTMEPSAHYDYAYTITQPPQLVVVDAVTTDGSAKAKFIPGAFASTGATYNSTATGWINVTATWTNATSGLVRHQDVTLVWKNYPYLSVTVPGDACKDVTVGDKVNITVMLYGDGAALNPKPIDVVVATDLSGSMNGDPAKNAKKAAKVFAASMKPQDRIGLESYGRQTPWPYTWDAYAQDDLALTYVADSTALIAINATIDTYPTSSGGNTPTRPAIYNATRLIKNDANYRPEAVKAILLLTDGVWNTCRAPKGAWNAMAFGDTDPIPATGSVIQFAKDNNIRIYAVGLGSGVDTTELTSYATLTGGKYYPATTSAELATIYRQIAGDLQETAGGETVVSLDFGMVNVNDQPYPHITDYMDYVADVHSPAQITDSTYLNKTNYSPSTGLSYHYTGFPLTVDNTGNWPNNMVFPVGTMKLYDTWSATFRLNMTNASKVTLFDPAVSNSTICFTDASTNRQTCQKISPLVCNIKQGTKQVPFGSFNLSVSDLTVTPNVNDPNVITIKWKTTYDGLQTVAETVTYQFQDQSPKPLPLTVPDGTRSEMACVDKENTITVDTSTWTVGHYNLEVSAYAIDAKPAPPLVAPFYKPGPPAPKYIKLE